MPLHLPSSLSPSLYTQFTSSTPLHSTHSLSPPTQNSLPSLPLFRVTHIHTPSLTSHTNQHTLHSTHTPLSRLTHNHTLHSHTHTHTLSSSLSADSTHSPITQTHALLTISTITTLLLNSSLKGSGEYSLVLWNLEGKIIIHRHYKSNKPWNQESDSPPSKFWMKQIFLSSS